MNYSDFFKRLTGHIPFPYQAGLADQPWPELVDIPTGLGKTAAILGAFLWKRLQSDEKTGRRLIYCLPMRSLVQQTHRVASEMCAASADLFDSGMAPSAHILMGGDMDTSWERDPVGNKILIGTQDMLLSRALNRGYAMTRYKWPVHFSLMTNDCLWILDETQLIGVGIETTAQLSAFQHDMGTFGPAHTIWMSATLGQAQLETVDHPAPNNGFPVHSLTKHDNDLERVTQRLDAKKSSTASSISLHMGTKATKEAKAIEDTTKGYGKRVATEVLRLHTDRGGLTLVVVNRVERAQEVFVALQKIAGNDHQLALIHSRFRSADREVQEKVLFNTGDRIVVATQAIEAGVDVSATTLVTELCPWPSLVQRLGRLNRYGEQAEGAFHWIDIQPKNEKDQVALPYESDELLVARHLISELSDVGPASLAEVNYQAPKKVRPVLRRRDVLDLFDTSTDLSGNDVDVSRYIRDNEDSDVQVYFRTWQGDIPDAMPEPTRGELCRISLASARVLLGKLKKKEYTAWTWDALDNHFKEVDHAWAGQVWLLAPTVGIYSAELGYTGKLGKDQAVPIESSSSAEDNSMGGDPDTSIGRWVRLTEHLRHVESEVASFTHGLSEELVSAVRTAARWHDVGKAHPVFQEKLVEPAKHDPEIAAPGDGPWAKSSHMLRHKGGRKHFRHELASALAYLQLGNANSEEERSLVAYLIAAHHGKVRLSIRSLPTEKGPEEQGRRFARGVWEGDSLPRVELPNGEVVEPAELSLECMELGEGSWTERALGLRDAKHLGPFRMAYLETLVRVADWIASEKEQNGGYNE